MGERKHLKIGVSKKDRITQLLCNLICLLFLLFFVIPIAYVLILSVHSHSGWSLDGYGILLENKMVLTGLKNSIFLAAVGTVYSLALEIPAAYVLSKREYGWLTNVFFALGQFGVALLPLYLLLKQLGLLNTLWGLILPSGISVHYTQLLRARMINLSAELEDAASLDGCGSIGYLLRICLPVMGPTVGVFGFFHACSYWGSTLLAKTLLTEESKFPLTLVLNQLLIQNQASSVFGTGTTVSSIAATQMAEFGLCVISTVPLIGIFLLMRRHIRTLEIDGGLVL